MPFRRRQDPLPPPPERPLIRVLSDPDDLAEALERAAACEEVNAAQLGDLVDRRIRRYRDEAKPRPVAPDPAADAAG